MCVRDRPAQKGVEPRGLPARSGEGSIAARPRGGLRRAARTGCDRPALRTNHRRGTYTRATRRSQRDSGRTPSEPEPGGSRVTGALETEAMVVVMEELATEAQIEN